MNNRHPTRRRHILALLTDGVGGHGGIARYNGDLIAALARSGLVGRIDVLPRLASPPTPLPDGVHQFPAPPSRAHYLAAVARHARRMSEIDIVFCGHINLIGLAAAVARLRGARLWLQVHGIDAWAPPANRVTRAAVASAHLVTAVSRHTRARFLAWSNIAPHVVRVLPNTYAARFHAGPKPQDLAERYGLVGRKVLLTVARLSTTERYKGHDRVITALPAIAKRHPSIAYLVVGDGDDRARLEQLSRDTGVGDRTVFAGIVDEAALADHYRLADAFVMPSDGEGFGIVYLEAAAMGLPVVAGNRDGSSDALADGTYGILVDPHDMEAIAGAVDRALSAPAPVPVPERFSTPAFDRHVAGLIGLLTSADHTDHVHAHAA